MRHYEIMIILDPNLEERTVQPSLEGFLKVVTADGGKVGKLDIWGKRRLSYPIDKKPEGIYAIVDLTANPAPSRSSTVSSTSTRACCGPRSCGPSTADKPFIHQFC
jgi:small subunit ribosomal protein S6